MKELTTSIRRWRDGLERRWKQLPVKDAQHIVLYGFAAYVVITIAVLVQVIYQISTAKSTIPIKHISNPVAKVKSNKKVSETKAKDDERE